MPLYISCVVQRNDLLNGFIASILVSLLYPPSRRTEVRVLFHKSSNVTFLFKILHWSPSQKNTTLIPCMVYKPYIILASAFFSAWIIFNPNEIPFILKRPKHTSVLGFVLSCFLCLEYFSLTSSLDWSVLFIQDCYKMVSFQRRLPWPSSHPCHSISSPCFIFLSISCYLTLSDFWFVFSST